jgi:anti-sigma-K factor RskA
MTDPGPDHARFDELAAAHALDALDPDDERRFLSHARHCPLCQQALADYADVAAALAETAPPAEPSPQLGPRILAAALAGEPRNDHPDTLTADQGTGRPGPQPAPDGQVVPLRRHPRPRWLKAAAAAAAVAVIAGGTWAGLAASRGGSTPQPLAACAHPHACPQVLLTETTAHRTAARVIVDAGSAWLLPLGLPADDAAHQVYVLWQVTAAHAPLPVGSFDIRPGAHQPIRIGSLTAPYHGTKAFAVSLERGRAIPASPSHLVALGHLSA